MKPALLMIGLGLLLCGEEARSEPEKMGEIFRDSDPESLEFSESLAQAEEERKISEEAKRHEEEVRSKTMSFFQAIAEGQTRAVCLMLNAGFDPDSDLPWPVPQEFVKQFDDHLVRYYVSSERGFTALMLATCLGNEVFVRILLAAGATPNKMTKRHKTFALWLAGKYGHLEIMRLLMRIGPEDPSRFLKVVVDLDAQRATLYRHNQLVMEMPISSGKRSHPTPTGQYLVTNKYKMWKSTLYHAKMPNFLRLSCGDFGLHAGHLPGYPASHGCIRLPSEMAKALFEIVPGGTLVEIVDSGSPASFVGTD